MSDTTPKTEPPASTDTVSNTPIKNSTGHWPEIFGAALVAFVIWLTLTQTG